MRIEQRLMLSLVAAAALGLSCTACLGPGSLDTSSRAAPQPVYAGNFASAERDVIRLGATSAPTPVTETVELARVDYQQQSQPEQSQWTAPRRPMGEVNGIDLTVAEIAQAVSPSHTPVFKTNQFDDDISRRVDAGYTFYANAQDTGLGLDLALKPHVTFDRNGDTLSTRAGAEVRIGIDLDLRGKPKNNSSWYLFAGADGEAIVWDVQRANTRGIADGQVTLQDTVTVGDVQAGVAWESPAGQMSVSYIEREYEYRNGAISRTGQEDFVALTLSWRR